MAVSIIPTLGVQANALLAHLYQAIDERHVITWRYDDFKSVRYLTHCADQWDKKAWLRPSIQNGNLVLSVVKPEKSQITWAIFGVFQGRFIEMMNTHFHDEFESATATARPASSDIVE